MGELEDLINELNELHKSSASNATPDEVEELKGMLIHRLSNKLSSLPRLLRIYKAHGSDKDLDLLEEAIQSALDTMKRIASLTLPGQSASMRMSEVVESAIKQATLPDNVKLHVDLATTPMSINVAKGQFVGEILISLLINGLDAMPQGGTLLIGAEQIDFGRIELRVTDSGEGMAKEIAPKIFEPGFSTRKQKGGQGLGLWLSRKLAERLGGTLELESSTLGQGSTFVLKLPVDKAT